MVTAYRFTILVAFSCAQKARQDSAAEDLSECSSLLFKRTNEFHRLRKILRSF